MGDVTDLLGELRGQTPPAEPYHPAVARRKLRQDLRTLQETTALQDSAALRDSMVSDSPEGSTKP
jgi:hypothetical protein